MSTIKIPPKRWVENILLPFKKILDPSSGFLKYEFGKMYTMYQNYLEFSCTQLEDFLFYEFLDDGYALKYGVPKPLIKKLENFRTLTDKFYDDAKELSDFEVIRRKEWDEIIPLAQECYDGLKEIYDALPGEEAEVEE